jgi:hypothetical protein
MQRKRVSAFGLMAFLSAGFLASNALPQNTASAVGAKPKVRAITAFVRINRQERGHLEDKIQEALRVVRRARSMFLAMGYETETIRVVTQPV